MSSGREREAAWWPGLLYIPLELSPILGDENVFNELQPREFNLIICRMFSVLFARNCAATSSAYSSITDP